jgi:hypothetical protein
MNTAVGRLTAFDWKALARRLRPSGERIWLALTVLWCLFLLRDLVNVKLGTYYFIIDPAHFHHGLVTDAYMIGFDLFLASFYWFMYQRSKNTIR